MNKAKSNILDRAILSAFPTWGAKRMAMRESFAQWQNFQSSYRGGMSTRTDNGWVMQGGATGQTFLDRQQLASMRDRSRNVDANNPIGHGMLNRIVDNVVGEGFTLQAKTIDKAFNLEAEERFSEFWRKADVRGIFPGAEIERQLQRAHERDGDVGLILVERGGRPRVQMVEAHQIATPDGRHAVPNLIDGVELNRVGGLAAFHILSVDEIGKRTTQRVTAENFLFYPRLKRLNGVRGEPCFAQIFSLLDQIDGYVDAVVIAARMAAIFGLIIKEGAPAKTLNGLGTLTNSQGQQQRGVTLENGMMKYIGRDDDVVQVQAGQPMQQTPDFIAAMLRLIGLPLDLPLEMVMLDFSRVNFSSARASFLQFYRAMRPKQNYFRDKILSPVYEWWIEYEVRHGHFTTKPPERFTHHTFMPRGWQWVDPVKEGVASLLEISMGTNTRKNIAASLGRDFDEIIATLATETAAIRSAEIPLGLSVFTRDPAKDKADAEADATPQEPTGDDFTDTED